MEDKIAGESSQYKRLSIIVPMYNVEPYVERCIHSLENQDISADDFEIICINDGSPDKCSEVVNKLKLEYNNIILIEQENQGVSRARNNGIDIAKGKYLLFIDPDDFVKKNCLKSILENAENQRAQVSFLGYTILKGNGSVLKEILNMNEKGIVFTGMDAYLLSRGDGRFDPDRMWGVLFGKDFFNGNNFRFLADVPYLEDGELIARILCLADSCIFDGTAFYIRTTRPGSATNSNLFRTARANKGFLIAVTNLKSFQQDEDLNNAQKVFLNQPIAKFVLLVLDSAIGWKNRRIFKHSIKRLKTLSLVRVDLVGCSNKYRKLGRAYNISPYIGAFSLLLYPRLERVFQLLRRLTKANTSN